MMTPTGFSYKPNKYLSTKDTFTSTRKRKLFHFDANYILSANILKTVYLRQGLTCTLGLLSNGLGWNGSFCRTRGQYRADNNDMVPPPNPAAHRYSGTGRPGA